MAKGFLLTNVQYPDFFGGAKSGYGGMDVAMDSGGHVVELEGRERVRHDMLKGILTGRTGTYGTTLPSLIGSKGQGRERGFVDLAIATVQMFVDDYRENQRPDLPDEELIDTVRTLTAEEDPFDRTRIVLILVLDMADGQSIEIQHSF